MQLIRQGLFLCVGLVLAISLARAEGVARLELVDGTVHVIRGSGKRVIVAQNSMLEVGDTVSTEKDSYARLRFTDGSEVALRPASSLVVTQYSFREEKPEEDNTALRLLKGGLRTVSGLIGKRGNQDAYKLQGGAAVIGIRGTEFIARLCQNDCNVAALEDKKKVAPAADSTPVAARIAESKGQNFVSPLAAPRRALGAGEPLYSGDIVDVDAKGYLVLVFSDQTRVVLNSGSRYALSSVHYDPRHPERSNQETELIKGGLRMLTGLLGKVRPDKVNVKTELGSIGIRGTNFDVRCAPAGRVDPAAQAAVSCSAGSALFAQTRDGLIELTAGGSVQRIGKGEAAVVGEMGGIPALLRDIPAFLSDNPAPQPEDIKIDLPALFGQSGEPHDAAGLYVEVKSGAVALQSDGRVLMVRQGEMGFVAPSGGELYRLNGTPGFMARDPWLRSMQVDPSACRAN